LGNSWEDACYLAVRLAGAYGGMTIPQDVLLTTEWAPIASRSELTEEQVIDLRKDDLSRRQRMRERGYSEEEIDRIEAEREDEKEAEPPPVAPVVAAEGGAEDVEMTESGPEQAEEEAA
jgi:broad-specificity NMP kinase